MREILFRGKRVDNGEWVYGFYGKRGYSSYIIQEIARPTGGYSFNDIEIEPETVSQLADYYDDEGGEVFEGDEVSVTHFKESFDGFVYWCDVSLSYKVKTSEGRSFMLSSTTRCLVTGNMHDK